LTTYRAWAQLNMQAIEEWSYVFPNGKVPIKTIAAQNVRFEDFKDPESVFYIDWDKLAIWQHEALLEKFGYDGLVKEDLLRVGFSLGRSNFCRFGSFDITFGDLVWRVFVDDHF
jgi:hypothetical protein